jgi:hypothetical protein
MRTITRVRPAGASSLEVSWSDRTKAVIDLAPTLRLPAFKVLRDPSAFARVETGDWGHSISWSTGEEIGADTLWLQTLTAIGKDDARRFLEWRLRNGLSLSKAAMALGLSRRMVAYYSNGEKPVPRHVLLACRGWEAEAGEGRAYPEPPAVAASVHEEAKPFQRPRSKTKRRAKE